MSSSPFTNRLIHETSPYLRQHAQNPVNWYPWGTEALELARRLDRPIFLSIGYSACHWCHVMERESFEDPEIGRLLNDSFVSIKVDREERPDLDQIYMNYVVRSRGQGGWPLSVFLTPDLKPFFGGTYYPPDDRYGDQLPSFRRVLLALRDAWHNRRPQVQAAADAATEQLQAEDQLPLKPQELREDLLRDSGRLLARVFDRRHGGFGAAPKFPHPIELRLLLRLWKRFGDNDALNMACLTFERLAHGGIYDQLGGGFHRYSTDARWLVPHFEKMLYDNALLTVAYLEAYQATGTPFYRQIAEETLTYVLREMTSPEGPFYSTQDADSEGVEGKFYVWSLAEIEAVLGKNLAEVFNYVYGVTMEGNWEGHNILHRLKTDEQDARLLGLKVEELRARLDEARRRLLGVRCQRVWPGRDDKVLTAWNGLMIDAFALAAQVLDRPDYAEVASRAADFLLQRLRAPDGRLLRTISTGGEARLNAYLEDYAFLINALVTLYEATFAPRWLDSAQQLTAVLLEQFWDGKAGGFYFTGRDHEQLITRPKDLLDNATPSGNGAAALALLRLAALTGRADLRHKAITTMQLSAGLMASHPLAVGQLLLALDFYLGPVQEFAVIGPAADPETQRVLRTLRSGFRPHQVVALGPAEGVPLLAGKTARERVTTYRCQNFACQEPWVGAEAVEQALS